jgi:hypothetical protein
MNEMFQSTTAGSQWQPVTKTVKRITKTIDRYDVEGRLIGREVITEEHEDVEKQVWELQTPYEVTCNCDCSEENCCNN